MWKKLPFKGLIYISFTLNIAGIGVTLLSKNILPPVVPLFYGFPIGYRQLTPTIGLLILPALGIVVNIINLLLTRMTKDLFLKQTLILSAVFNSILTTIALIKIIFLVGFF